MRKGREEKYIRVREVRKLRIEDFRKIGGGEELSGARIHNYSIAQWSTGIYI